MALDLAYIRWWADFAPFEARCFAALCKFVRVHFDDLLDRYYLEGHESLNDFPAWTFERYLRQVEQTGATEEVQGPRQARTFSVEQRSVPPSLGETLTHGRRESTDTRVGG
jgi:hypothetical protein